MDCPANRANAPGLFIINSIGSDGGGHDRKAFYSIMFIFLDNNRHVVYNYKRYG